MEGKYITVFNWRWWRPSSKWPGPCFI